MRRFALLTAAFGLACVPQARAAFSGSDAGTAAGQFLKLGADARAAAMGQAARALCEDASAVYWNPAGLGALSYRSASLTHASYYQSTFYEFLAYAQPIDSILGRSRRELQTNQLGAVGVGVFYLNSGRLTEVDNTGAATGGSFTPQDFAAIVAWGAALTRSIDAGVGFKYVSSRIRDTAATGAADLGVRLRQHPWGVPYVLSASLHNLGGRLRFHKESDPLPVQLAVSQSLRPTRNISLSLDVVAPRDNRVYPAFGAEFRKGVGPNLAAAVRLGWEGRTRGSDLSSLSGLGLGAGLGVARFTVDYAWTPYGLLGDAHRFTLSYRF
ncbi:MAG: PorV/PorQ family protein [Elusimicrobia bacterium]|nr:PorV/PorQ family protein [Elusimicrobiota bacterium]